MDNQVEQRRNRMLRRADWRYLLANPWPEKSACFAGGFLSQAVQAVSSHTVSANVGIAEECDLVVATNPDATTLQNAWRLLQFGGEIYCEWYSPLVGGLSGIRRRLESAGFTHVKCYWPWPIPSISPALFWLPLEAPDTLSYFLSKRQRSTNLLTQIGRGATLLLWKLLHKAGLLVPTCVTAQKPGSKVTNALPLDSAEYAPANQGEENSALNFQQFDTLMWTGGKRSINKVVLYMFAPGEKVPCQVVKLPRTAETTKALIHEANILQALRLTKSGPASRAPEVLFLSNIDGKLALGETTVSGEPIYTLLNKENALDLAMKVTEWLASLAAGEPLCPREIWWNKQIEPALADFEQAFKPVLDDLTISKCRAILSRLPDLPQVFEHRDCSPWNLLVTPEGELAVLDWESAEQYGLPAVDLTYFLAYMMFFLDGAMKNRNFIASYRRVSDEMTFNENLWATCQQLYIERTGLDTAALYPLRLLTWIIHSRSEAQRIAEDSGGSPQPSALHQSLFYQLVLEEVSNDANAGVKVQ